MYPPGQKVGVHLDTSREGLEEQRVWEMVLQAKERT
jgi:hypothetical protein